MTSYAGYVAANLNSGLKLGIEYGNETWNFTNPRTFILSWGAALGWNLGDGSSNLTFTGLRTKQYSDVIRSAWVSAGRSAHDFYMLSMHQCGSGGIGGPFDLYQNKGQLLNATNFPLFGNYGGLGVVPYGNQFWYHLPEQTNRRLRCYGLRGLLGIAVVVGGVFLR